MKYAVLILMSFVSSIALADGYRCEGQGYRVKMYNHVHRELGTKNAAVLIVSSDKDGTIAVLKAGTDLAKTNLRTSWAFEGLTHVVATGQFAFTRLVVQKDAKGSGALSETHDTTLVLNADNEQLVIDLDCEEYRKSDR